LERWTAGMRNFVALLNNDILLQHVSLRITFFHFIVRNNLCKIFVVPSYLNSKAAKITFCCSVQIALFHFGTHILNDDVNECFN